MTGQDEGFEAFINDLTTDSTYYPGSKNYFKIIFENDNPIAAVVYCVYEHIVTIAEIVVAPEERDNGKGTEIIKELLQICNETLGDSVNQFKCVIFPNNTASQKAFE